MKPDILGEALKAYHFQNDSTPLIVNNDYGDPETMPIESLYRKSDKIPDYEWVMVDLAFGKTLDIGSGCGSHTLLLQEKGLEVQGVEMSSGACEVAIERGVYSIINDDFRNLPEEKFDTLSLVMNGIGIVGSVQGLQESLTKFKKMLNPNGQVVFDTTDISYLKKKQKDNSYFGEVKFQFEYRNFKGDWFSWVYFDTKKLKEICNSMGWNMQVVFHEDDEHYVGRLTLS